MTTERIVHEDHWGSRFNKGMYYWLEDQTKDQDKREMLIRQQYKSFSNPRVEKKQYESKVATVKEIYINTMSERNKNISKKDREWSIDVYRDEEPPFFKIR